MLFDFLKYVQPTWYFNLTPAKGKAVYWVDYHKLPPEEKRLIDFDENFSTSDAPQLDAAYQALHKGIIKDDAQFVFEAPVRTCFDIADNYRFIKKYYRAFWTYYIFCRRILSFHNPIKEIQALQQVKHVRKVNLHDRVKRYDQYENFASPLLAEVPFISVIVPTLNRYPYLKDVFVDLARQDYTHFEVIVIDQTDEPDRAFYDQLKLQKTVVFQEGKGQWLSRNEAVRIAGGDFLLFYDDDSRVEPDWITQHIKGLDFFGADITAGVSFSKTGGEIPKDYSYFRWASQFDSGNALVKREVFESIGLFDRQFDKMRMGDGEFGLRAYLFGFKSISHPYASRLHLKVDSGGLRQMGSWDAFRSANLFAPKPIPSVLYLYRKYFPASNVKNALILGVFPSLIPYKFKRNKVLYPVGILMAIVMLPVLSIQVFKSWKRAGAMLQEGDKIEVLKQRNLTQR